MTDQASAAPTTVGGPASEAIVVAEEVHKSFGSLHVLRGVNLAIDEGDQFLVELASTPEYVHIAPEFFT